MSKEVSDGLRRSVREASVELVIMGWDEGDASSSCWRVVRESLGKSYSDCDDSDIPPALEALDLFIQRMKDETRR